MSESEIEKNFRLGIESVKELDESQLYHLGELIARELRERDRKRRPMTKDDIEKRYQANRPPRYNFGKGVLRHLRETLDEKPFTSFDSGKAEGYRKRMEEGAGLSKNAPQWMHDMMNYRPPHLIFDDDKPDASRAHANEEDKREMEEEMEKVRREKEKQAREAHTKLDGLEARLAHEQYTPAEWAERLAEDSVRAGEGEYRATVDTPAGLDKRVTYIEEVIEGLRGQVQQLDAGIVRWDREIEDFRQELRGTRQHSMDAINQIRRETLPIHQQAEENAGILELHRERIKELSERVEKLGAQAGEMGGELGEISTLRGRIGKLEGQHDESPGGGAQATVIPIHPHEAEATPEYGRKLTRQLEDADKHTRRIRRTSVWVEEGDPPELVFEISWNNGVVHRSVFAPAKMSESLKFVIVPERYWIDLLPIGAEVDIERDRGLKLAEGEPE